jgi:hypothetical protein
MNGLLSSIGELDIIMMSYNHIVGICKVMLRNRYMCEPLYDGGFYEGIGIKLLCEYFSQCQT